VRAEGASRDLVTDHIIAATGYRFAARSLPFLNHCGAIYNFRPLMRFLCGSQYTAERICRHSRCDEEADRRDRDPRRVESGKNTRQKALMAKLAQRIARVIPGFKS
jgi:hypothetical protein